MIRYKDKIFEEYSIDPVTAIITNSKGEVQEISLHKDGRPYFKGMAVHAIQLHTKYGYKPGYDVHHLDHNPMNNALSNLVYLTHSEHATIHNKGKKLSEEHKNKLSEALKGRQFSEEARKNISESKKGEKNPMYGKKGTKNPMYGKKGTKNPNYGKRFKWINNGIEQRFLPFDEETPEGFKRGMLKRY